jgi:hypothetical protein
MTKVRGQLSKNMRPYLKSKLIAKGLKAWLKW